MNALLGGETKVKDHLGKVLDGHGAVILQRLGGQGAVWRRGWRGGRTTERNALPMARKTLLFASSGWRRTWGGGNWG
jgi:hypothetical protein